MATDLHEFLVKHRITAHTTVSRETLMDLQLRDYVERDIPVQMIHAFGYKVIEKYLESNMIDCSSRDLDGANYQLSLYVLDSKSMEQLIDLVTKKAKEDKNEENIRAERGGQLLL